MTVWVLFLVMYHGASTEVISMRGDVAACSERSQFEMRWNPMVQFTMCVPWQGDEA